MKGNKILYAGIAILILGIGFAAGTYAYYQSTITGSATGTVLAWWCKADGDSATLEISMGSLHPGTSGQKDIAITSSMAADYTITFGTLNNMGSGNSVRPNLKLYKTKSGTNYSNEIGATDTISGSTTGSNGNYSATATFYWDWPYGTSSETYSTAAPSVQITLTCSQKNV